MYSLTQLIALIQAYAQGGGDLSVFAPAYSDESTYAQGDIVSKDDKFYQAKADIGTAEEWNAEHWNEVTFEEALKPYLNGKFVRIMLAPSSATLTDEQIAQISEGVFIKGDFLGLKNPILLPFGNLYSGRYLGIIMGKFTTYNDTFIGLYQISEKTLSFNRNKGIILKQDDIIFGEETVFYATGRVNLRGKEYPLNYPADTAVGHFICRKGTLQWYIPVAQDNITSGDTIALTSDLGKALIDHLDVEINGYRARYEYTDGNYVVYSSKSEADSGLKLQVNMISYNTTNGELSFNQMTFTPDA